MAEPTAPPVLPPDASARLAEFARACKAAARAVSLYPAAHPAIGTTLGRLLQVTPMLTANGPYRLQVMADALLIGGAVPARPDPAISELAELLHRQLSEPARAGDKPDRVVSPVDPADYAIDPLNFLPA